MNEAKNIKISLTISALSLIVALIAAISSFYAINITKKQHILERSLVLIAEYNSEKSKIIVYPFSKDIKLLRARIHFPPSFTMVPESINSNGYVSDMSVFEVNARSAILAYHKEIKSNYLYAIQIPVVIESYYAASGNTYSDTSRYILSLKLKLENTCDYFPTVYDADLLFEQRDIVWSDDYQIRLENIFEKIIKDKFVILPARHPARDL